MLSFFFSLVMLGLMGLLALALVSILGSLAYFGCLILLGLAAIGFVLWILGALFTYWWLILAFAIFVVIFRSKE